jgi:hypothetical protein
MLRFVRQAVNEEEDFAPGQVNLLNSMNDTKYVRIVIKKINN